MSAEQSPKQVQHPQQMTPKQLLEQAQLHEQKGEHEHALAYYRFLIANDPGHALCLFRLGNLLYSLDRSQEALPYYKVLSLVAPEYAAGRINYAMALKKAGRLDQAIKQLEQVLRREPENLIALQQLADSCRTQNNLQQALPLYERWAALEPQNPKAAYMLAAVKSALAGGRQAPERAPDDYVASYFDQYAQRFDQHTTTVLRYRGPELLRRLAEASSLLAQSDLEVLDLGCGTGLCGAFMAPVSSRIDGIDLSPAMLELSRARGIYTGLLQGDLHTRMLELPPASYDVITAGDVFCYIGSLRPVFEQALRLLKPLGSFLFTVEALTYNERDAGAEGYMLRDTGRYAHDRAYLEELASDLGFTITGFGQEGLRLEYGKPISGWIALFQRQE
jgi:predicted TPR repeat methyltransferase